MTNIYNLLSDDLTRGFNWRLREIHQLRTAISDVADLDKGSVARASFVLLYAHWEGFIKRSTELFFNYIIRLNKPVHELHVGAKVVCLRREIVHALTYGNKTNKQIVALLQIVAESGNKKLTKRHAAHMVQSANMTFSEFADTCILFGIESSEFDEYQDLIDKILVHKRHQIAHGAYLHVGSEDFVSTSDDVIAVMRRFRNQIENVFLERVGFPGANAV